MYYYYFHSLIGLTVDLLCHCFESHIFISQSQLRTSQPLVAAMGRASTYVYTVVCFTLLATVEVTLGDPTLQEVTAAQCPTHRPFKCLPYGTCCSGDEYCTTGSGTCESCFPNVQPTDLLTWCQQVGLHNASRMRDATCSLACQARFTIHQLATDGDLLVHQDVDNELTSDKDQDDYWYHRFMVMCIVSVILLCSTVTFLSLLCYVMFGRRRRRSSSRRGLEFRQGPRSRSHVRRPLSHRNEVNYDDEEEGDSTPRYTDLVLTRVSATESKSSHENEYVTPSS